MNEVLSQLHARKSVRAFLDRPIPPEARRAILEAACAAPTAGNQQLYTILDITDQAVKDTLADTCDHQPFIARAPLVLIFCADCQKWYDAFAAGGCSPRRRALEHIVHENAYRRMEPAELEAMLADNAGARPYGTWLDAFCKRKYNSDFSREMSRSMAEYLKPFLP